MASKKHAGGRPPKFKSKEEIEEKIERYFEKCRGHPLVNEQGEAVLNKYGLPVMVDVEPVTVTGLALALGFTNRQSLLRYQGKKEFCDTVTRAKTMVEQYAEQRLFDRDGTNGAQFSLRCNFNWTDKPEAAADDEKDTELSRLYKALEAGDKP